MNTKKILARTALAFGSVCFASNVQLAAQEVYSSIIGAVSMTVPAESDLFVTPSFSNSAVFRSDVTAAAVGGVTFSSATFDADAYSGHFLLIEEGTLAGRMFEIETNTATGLTLTEDQADMAGALNQLASIVPPLTLGEMFPNGLGGKVEVNPGNPDLILFSNDNSAGVEGFAPESVYYYGDIALDSNDDIVRVPGWRKFGAPLSESYDDATLPLGEGFVVRNNSGTAVSFFLFGEVMLSQVKIPISSTDSGSTDNFVGAPRPLSIALGDLGLEEVVDVTDDANVVKDTVRIFPSDSTGKNPAPDAVYCRWSDGWREVVNGVVDTGVDTLKNDVLIPGAAALVVRKVQTGSPEVVYWTNSWDLPTQS